MADMMDEVQPYFDLRHKLQDIFKPKKDLNQIIQIVNQGIDIINNFYKIPEEDRYKALIEWCAEIVLFFDKLAEAQNKQLSKNTIYNLLSKFNIPETYYDEVYNMYLKIKNKKYKSIKDVEIPSIIKD
jgi:hypothetical protein